MLKGDATAEPGRDIPFEKKLEDAVTYSIGGGGARRPAPCGPWLKVVPTKPGFIGIAL